MRSVLFALTDAAADLARGAAVAAASNPAAVYEQRCVDHVVRGLSQAPAGLLVCDRLDAPLALEEHSNLVVTLSPLAGLAGSPGDLLAGMLFAVHALETPGKATALSGTSLRAAGLAVLGIPTVIALAFGDGVDLYELDSPAGEFLLARARLEIPPGRRELAVDPSNYRLWDSRVRHYVEACIAGEEGPQGVRYALHWHGSLAPELLRVLTRGGLYLAPDDARPGCAHGSHEFLCQALPAAWLVEHCGGRAIDGYGPILARPEALPGTRVPLICGSRDAVVQVQEYLLNDPTETTRYPLFETRSLLRS